MKNYIIHHKLLWIATSTRASGNWTTSDVLPKWFWWRQAKSDNDCDKNCPSELPSLHYDAFTTPKPGYTKRIFPLISISTLPLFTAGSTRRLQLFQSARSLISKAAYLTCSTDAYKYGQKNSRQMAKIDKLCLTIESSMWISRVLIRFYAVPGLFFQEVSNTESAIRENNSFHCKIPDYPEWSVQNS